MFPRVSLIFYLYTFLLIMLMLFFFFSSRRRHTRCALVTGVQTCALPIYLTRSTHRTGLSVWLPSYSDSVYQARSRATAEIGRRPFLVAAKRGKHPPHHSGHNAAP